MDFYWSLLLVINSNSESNIQFAWFPSKRPKLSWLPLRCLEEQAVSHHCPFYEIILLSPVQKRRVNFRGPGEGGGEVFVVTSYTFHHFCDYQGIGASFGHFIPQPHFFFCTNQGKEAFEGGIYLSRHNLKPQCGGLHLRKVIFHDKKKNYIFREGFNWLVLDI